MRSFHQFLIVFFLASIFRLTFMDLIEFKFDEAFTVFQMTSFFNDPVLFQTGPVQSTGMYNFPIFNYVMLVLSLFSRHPQYLSFMIGLINSLLIAVLYFAIKKFYGQKTAIFSSLFLIFSPWAIIFSRKIWMPDLILIFVIPSIYFLQSLILEKKLNSTFWLFLFLTLTFQFHASGAFFTMATILILLILRTRIDVKKAFEGIGLGLITAIPYFIRQLLSSPFCIDCQLFLKYQQIPKEADYQNFLRPLQLLNGSFFEILLGSNFPEFIVNLKIIELIFYSSFVILIISCILVIKYKKEYAFLILYVLIIPALYLITKTPSYMHYFVILFPVVAILLGLGFSILLGLIKSKLYVCVIYLFFIILIAANIAFEIKLIQFLTAKKVINGDYGPIFSETEKYINQETNSYLIYPEYDQIKSYAYFFPKPELLHAKLGEYLLKKNAGDLAIVEFKKALTINPKDIFSRANLTYIYILQNKKEEAAKEINILEQDSSTVSAELKGIMKLKFK